MDTAILDDVSAGRLVLLVLAILTACGFEFINGFHDTANAVATVIYTKTLRPWRAVIYSGVLNFLGVFTGGIAVALAIIKLLPVELLVEGGHARGLAMIFALLFSAMIWNFGTWYLGLPASSSHTLIGAILGVGIMNSAITEQFGHGVNWGQAWHVLGSLLVSPLVGFTLAALVLLIMHGVVKDRRVFRTSDSESDRPPGWVRALLIATCGGVSFAHGSNDGQKGVGLIMLMLIGILPATFAVNDRATEEQVQSALHAANRIEAVFAEHCTSRDPTELACIGQDRAHRIGKVLLGHSTVEGLGSEARWSIRESVLRIDDCLRELELGDRMRPERAAIGALTDYAPWWVLLVVAFSLGLGTMIGWKRIVVTVGEKIGKSHLTYAQGAAAELVAMSTIGLSSFAGLPVSTTHMLSSGIAGTMVIEGSGLQLKTIKQIALAWVLTLPASMLLSALLFYVFTRFAG